MLIKIACVLLWVFLIVGTIFIGRREGDYIHGFAVTALFAFSVGGSLFLFIGLTLYVFGVE